MVVRYSFLWSREAQAGADEGQKDRPCAIVVATPPDRNGNVRVVVVPVSHSAPSNPAAAIVLPPSVKAALGLDDAPSWICLDELNMFAWPGYDLRPIPGSERYDYGVLPQALFDQVRDGIIALRQANRMQQVTRD